VAGGNKLEIITWTLGPMANNIYLLKNECEKSIIIDPAWGDDHFAKEASTKHKPIGLILLTHGHFDHCLSVAYVKEQTGVELWLHEKDKNYLERNVEKAMLEFGIEFPPTNADKLLKDNEIIKWGEDEIKVIHTPGHTPGGVCYLIEKDKILVTGDTLFAGSVGRWDFSGGNGRDLFKSIKDRIMTLDDDIKIYPGHGPSSTIGRERKSNQLLRMSMRELGLE
jgi:hydroxyacylglutathione hydrolase